MSIAHIEDQETAQSVTDKWNKIIDLSYGYRSENIRNYPTWDITSGSGSVTDPVDFNIYHEISTGATAGSVAVKRFGYRTGHVIGDNAWEVDFDKAWEAHIVLGSFARSTNGVTGFYIGKKYNAGVGDLSAKGIGFALKNEDLYLQAYGGTTLTSQDTGSDINDDQDNVHLIQLYFEPATSLSIWLDGTEIDEITTNLPSGTQSTAIVGYFEAANNADAVDVISRLYYAKIINEY